MCTEVRTEPRSPASEADAMTSVPRRFGLKTCTYFILDLFLYFCGQRHYFSVYLNHSNKSIFKTELLIFSLKIWHRGGIRTRIPGFSGGCNGHYATPQICCACLSKLFTSFSACHRGDWSYGSWDRIPPGYMYIGWWLFQKIFFGHPPESQASLTVSLNCPRKQWHQRGNNLTYLKQFSPSVFSRHVINFYFPSFGLPRVCFCWAKLYQVKHSSTPPQIWKWHSWERTHNRARGAHNVTFLQFYKQFYIFTL
jgi:hypothetical protein